jgi:ABC-type multidrug transport system fused ATPase/permease subunit
MTSTTSWPPAPTDSCGTVTLLNSATGQCAANIGTAVMPEVVRDVPNPVEVADDPVYPARSPWLSEADPSGRADSTDGTGTMPARVTHDHDSPLNGQPVVTDIDCLNVHRLGLTLPNGRHLVSDVSSSAHPGSLTAIIGPSGAGKSTLAKLVGGAITPTTGAVRFDGRDVHAEYGSLRHRIGLVPQDDVVHHQLTLEAALGYAAELRLPRATKEERREAVYAVYWASWS